MIKILHNIGDKQTPNYNTRQQVLDCNDVLTFDGVYKNVWENRDVLKGKEVILFIMGDYIGGNNDFDIKAPLNGALIYPEDYCDWQQICELVTMGCKLGWHTNSHRDLTKLTREELIEEITPPFSMDYFAMPYGTYNNEVIEIIKQCGYKQAFSVYQTNGTQWTIPRSFI